MENQKDMMPKGHCNKVKMGDPEHSKMEKEMPKKDREMENKY